MPIDNTTLAYWQRLKRQWQHDAGTLRLQAAEMADHETVLPELIDAGIHLMEAFQAMHRAILYGSAEDTADD